MQKHLPKHQWFNYSNKGYNVMNLYRVHANICCCYAVLDSTTAGYHCWLSGRSFRGSTTASTAACLQRSATSVWLRCSAHSVSSSQCVIGSPHRHSDHFVLVSNRSRLFMLQNIFISYSVFITEYTFAYYIIFLFVITNYLFTLSLLMFESRY